MASTDYMYKKSYGFYHLCIVYTWFSCDRYIENNAKIHIAWHISQSGPYHRGLIWGSRDDAPCDMRYWILACIILFIVYYQVKIALIDEGKIQKYFPINLFVVTCFSFMTLLYACFAHVLILVCIFWTKFLSQNLPLQAFEVQ
jgi:hypothetical protein